MLTLFYAFCRLFKKERIEKGLNISDKAMQREFRPWIKEHVRKLQGASADLISLSYWADERILVYSACNVNGARFRTIDRDRNLRTQNSGVMNIAAFGDGQEMEHYGVVKEVIELEYIKNKYGNISVVLFQCDWFNLEGSSTTKMRDDGYFRSVNTSKLWYKNAPFILSSQENTCFTWMTQSMVILGRWCVHSVIGTCLMFQK